LSSRRSLSWWSTWKPPGRSASQSRPTCWQERIEWSD